MGIELICSQSLHRGLCFAAFCFLLRYRQYPTVALLELAAGALACQVSVTRWWPVFDDGCNTGRPPGGQAGRLGTTEARRFSFIAAAADSGTLLEAGLSRRIAMVATRRVAIISTSRPKTTRECDRIPKRPRTGESPTGVFNSTCDHRREGRTFRISGPSQVTPGWLSQMFLRLSPQNA